MKKYNFSTFLVSIYFDIAVVTFFLGIYLINPFLEKYGTKFQISIGLFLMSISLLIIAPIKIFPQNYIVTAIGFICLGFSEAPTIISTMEDFLITLKESEKFSEEYSTDLASAFFTFSVNIGCILGPIIGSYYTEKKSFYYSCIVLSIFCLFWFFVFGIGWFDFIVLDFKNRDNKNYHVVIEEKNEKLEDIVIDSDLVG
jgi:MFS family permease